MDYLKGKFIVFDGPDGSGKSTQFSKVIEKLSDELEIVTVREPGGTLIGEKIRGILLDPKNVEMSVVTEMLLYMASRTQLIAERILPALDRGALVLADRFVSATFAYQGSGGGLSHDLIEGVSKAACLGLVADLTILLDVDEQTSFSRMGKSLDRIEQKDSSYHARVRESFLDQANRNPNSWIVVDASKTIEEVWEKVQAIFDAFAIK